MPVGYLSEPLLFIANFLIGGYILILILRLLLQFSGADSRNQVSSVIIKVTQPPLKVLQPFFPTIKNFNLAVIALMLILQMALGFLIASGQLSVNVWTLFIWSLTESISNVINVFIYSIFGTVILSWINPTAYNSAIALLYKITEPILKPCQRIIPPMGGFDLSPMVALLGLQVLKMLILPPLFALI